MHHMGILSNRSIFAPLCSFKLNSCMYYVQYNTNPIGLVHGAIRGHNDYVILLFSERNQELTLSHFHERSLEQQSHTHTHTRGMLQWHVRDGTDKLQRLWSHFDLLNCG